MEKISYISSLIIGAGLFQGVFLAVLLFGVKKGNAGANRILALLLLAFSINIAHSVLFADIFKDTFSNILKINEPFQLVLGPLMYLYIRQLIHPQSQFKPKGLLHFLPFVIYCAIIMPLDSIPRFGPVTKTLMLYSNALTTIIWSITLIQITVYVAISHRMIKQHQRRIRECFSEIDRINLSWIKYFISILLCIYITYYFLLAAMLHVSDVDTILPHFQKIISIMLSLAIYGLGYRGLSQPKIFDYEVSKKMESIESEPSQYLGSKADTAKYEHSSLSPMASFEISNKLISFMEEERPYLNPELTLPELANMLGIARNKLSQVLNEELKVTFYDFVNGYRIKQVKAFMADSKYEHMKILALAFDAGFNSKATFNNIFKKIVGITPSEYRKQIEPTDIVSQDSESLRT